MDTGLPFLGSSKVSLKEIERIADRLEIEASDNLAVCGSEAVGVAALQLQLRPYATLAEYVVDMNLYIADAVNRRAQLVCLPAFAGLLPLSAAPQSHGHIRGMIPKLQDPALPVDIRGLNDALSALSDYAFDAYFYTMSALAARHKVYIMGGSTLYFEGNELCHRAFLWNDEGELAGYQDKIAEGLLEVALQIPPESEVRLFETPMGPVSILIGSDADYFECARIAARLGARLLLCPGAFLNEYTPIHSSAGPNMRAQENNVFAAQSTLVGDTGLGFSLEGGGRIYAPNGLLRHKNGVAAKTSGRREPDVAALTLNLERLGEVNDPYTHDRNPGFMQRFIDRLY